MRRDVLARAVDDFRRWYDDAVSTNGEAPPAPAPSIDLATLLGHYLGLRQEVNLQTRAVRSQQEQNAEVVRQLGQTVEMLARQQSRADQLERQNQEEKLRPLVMSLIELHDALSLAGREIGRVEDNILPALEEMGDEPDLEVPPAVAPGPASSVWARWFGSEPVAATDDFRRERQARIDDAVRRQETADRAAAALASVVTGYAMGLERVERALVKHGLEPIAAAGEPFDPERMEVLEAVFDSGRPGGEVLDEVRRGYTWNGRLLRCAQVRVARDRA